MNIPSFVGILKGWEVESPLEGVALCLLFPLLLALDLAMVLAVLLIAVCGGLIDASSRS